MGLIEVNDNGKWRLKRRGMEADCSGRSDY